MTESARGEFILKCGVDLNECPNIEEWLGRIEKLKRQLK